MRELLSFKNKIGVKEGGGMGGSLLDLNAALCSL